MLFDVDGVILVVIFVVVVCRGFEWEVLVGVNVVMVMFCFEIVEFWICLLFGVLEGVDVCLEFIVFWVGLDMEVLLGL